MENLNAKQLMQQAREQLDGKDSRKLAAFHTGVLAAVALGLTLMQYALSTGIGNTSGLSGLSTLSILETMQTVLQWINMILLPFWSLGFVYAALKWSRGEYARKEDLLTGFRRFRPYLGLTFNRLLLTICVSIISVNIGSIIYGMLPASEGLADLTAAASAGTEALYQAMEQMSMEELMALGRSLLPMMLIVLAIGALLLIPMLYRFRMAEYVILDQPGTRGLIAMLQSAALLRRRCWQLFLVDLKFWWYYGLKILCIVLCYIDVLLRTAGVALPQNGLVYLGSYLLYLVAMFLVETCFRPVVNTSYACAYQTLKELGPIAKRPVAMPERLPEDEN